MLKNLPPAGNPVLLASSTKPEQIFRSVFQDQPLHGYGTGTMALAAAFIAAKKLKALPRPEVLIPAYACPDLISAAVYAGVKPVLVDLEVDKPWMDLQQLSTLITKNTLAVTAVHFLGIPERIADIRGITEKSDILLIEDSAQLFPRSSHPAIWQGDLIVLSFGRGKPVSLLGGGGLICRKAELSPHLPRSVPLWPATAETTQGVPTLPGIYELKARAYNYLLKPECYGLLSSLPFISLGETHFHTLEELTPAESFVSKYLATNIAAYQQRPGQAQDTIAKMISERSGENIIDLPGLAADTDFPLLRYPLLMGTGEHRDRLLERLSGQGLGVSQMYPASLPHIPGTGKYIVGNGAYSNAESFAQRVLTLPCHSGVSEYWQAKLKSVLAEELN